MGIDKRLMAGKTARPGRVIGIGNPTIPMGMHRGDIGNTGEDFHSKTYWYGVGENPNEKSKE